MRLSGTRKNIHHAQCLHAVADSKKHRPLFLVQAFCEDRGHLLKCGIVSKQSSEDSNCSGDRRRIPTQGGPYGPTALRGGLSRSEAGSRSRRLKKTDIKGPWYSVTSMVVPPGAEGGSTVMRHMPPIVRGADVSTWRRPKGHNDVGVAPLCWRATSVGIIHAMQFAHAPSVSSMDLSLPPRSGARRRPTWTRHERQPRR